MELRHGYKPTEIGLIPTHWNLVVIDNCAIKVGSGITPKGGASVYKEAGRPFVRSQNVGWGELNLADIAFIDEETHASFSSSEINQKDVLLNITGASIGRCALATSDVSGGNVNQHVCIIRTNDKLIDADYLCRVLLSNIGQAQIESFQAGGNREGLNFGQIKSFKIPIPPTKAEQTAIANALSDADAWIQSLTRLIAKKRQIKQGAMQTLLNPYENGRLKAGWVMRTLGEIAFVTKLAGFEYTNYFNSYKDDGEIIVIRGTNITKNKLDLSDVKTIPKSTSNKLPRSKLNKGDLAFAYVGTIGPVYLVEDNDRFHLGPNTCKISAEKFICNKFLYVYFTSNFVENEIVKQTSIGAQPSLSMTKIRSFKISFPAKITEQVYIATTLFNMDNEIAILETKLSKAQQIKQGMMQNLLTGRIRLI